MWQDAKEIITRRMRAIAELEHYESDTGFID